MFFNEAADNKIILLFILFIGLSALLYFFNFIRMLFTQKNAVLTEPGQARVLIPTAFVIFFLQAMGFPDFVMGTIAYRKLKLVEDERLPQTLVMATIVPGALAAITYLQNGAAQVWTIFFCVIAETLGTVLGVRIVSKLNGAQIRRLMGCLMIVALVAFIFKTVLAPAGSLAGLPTSRLLFAMAILFVLGVFNMMGVPMKPSALLLLLLLGMSPTAALTVVLTMGSIGPITGGVTVLRSGKFQKKIVLYAATVGLVAALFGCWLALGLNQTVYTVILIVMMCYAAFDLLRKNS